MINLLKYYLKKRSYVITIISVLLILTALVFTNTNYILETTAQNRPYNNPISFIATMSCILCTLIPMFEFSFKMKKVSVDLYYSFPIKREKLFLVKLIIGLLEVIIPILVLCIFFYLRIITHDHIFSMKYFILFSLCLIIAIIFVFSIVSFVYTRCNTIHDGIINVFAYIAVVGVALYSIDNIVNIINDLFIYDGTIDPRIRYDNSLFVLNASSYKPLISFKVHKYADQGYIFTPITGISDLFQTLMNNVNTKEILTQYQITGMVAFSLAGIASIIGMLLLSKKDKSENAMNISDSWFSYKVLIPIYIVSIALDLDIVMAIVLGYICYAVFRRSFKIKLCDIITGVSCVITALIIVLLLRN